MKITLIIIAIIAALVGIVYGIGSTLPIKHTASQSRTFNKPPEVVWNTVANISEAASWRKDVDGITVTGLTTYKELSHGDEVEYEISNSVTGQSFTTTIITKDLPYGGTWNFEFIPEGDGCRLTITENGEIYSPIFRFISRFFIGHEGTMKTYLDQLGAKLGG
jgi:Polyketide cyclase / dehydrase and lipid transport